ncbi:head GIN domain-containing protein [Algoriphagus boritolerans]|uniref:Putative auto-transporter adhesin, head GIN domain n=1 Tax=Algoriphagus boritolerans DSM 17298 = JCM 18970 TaxID=1120964 RepID=A0A1H5TTZ7_9BACT|nr:head GIN domain-containing protein [Algoriphagus boritolerans]SEF65467.1 Putative auto-transporter adhesin, head GIN domain [Algoriphagus boritolerans DSM 17298 = JCM 18970]
MKAKLLSSTLILIALLQSCTLNFSRKTEESISDIREIEGTKKLKVSGIFNLYLSQSDNPALRIEGDEDLVQKLKVTQNGEWLELDFEKVNEKFFKKNSRVNVYLTVSELEEFVFDGVGNIKTESPIELDEVNIKGDGVGNLNLELQANTINAVFSMLGNIHLKGSVDAIRLTNDGMGNVDASDLIAQNMTLKTSGIGRVAVHCEGDLSITVDGIGAVSYTGNPNVIKEEINGIGKVTRN